MIRSSGVLLPMFSLPGPFGIGVFGEEAVRFAKQLVQAGFSRWLVLPFSPPGGYNSPYQCTSSFAGNPLFIDPRNLCQKGLLTHDEVTELYTDNTGPKVDYASVIPAHTKALRTAFSRISEHDREMLEDFLESEATWLNDYCLFMSAKDHFGPDLPWWVWPDEKIKHKDPVAIAAFATQERESMLYYAYEQFEFTRQWQALKDKINDIGIQVIGDLPIYPAPDSADLWGQRELFETNAEGLPSRVAGVPPDYFSEDGQLWGNPLYRWDKLKEQDYTYWIDRIGKSLEWYDMLRLDHFRGFESYWAVPAGEETAINGVWEKGPGMDMFSELLRIYPAGTIIAEDLGEITADVRQFLLATGLPGMKVLQFAFGSDENSKDRPHSYEKNVVAFTGTHDNDTFLGWARTLSAEEWQLVQTYFGLKNDARDLDGPLNPLCKRAILTLCQSVADLVIFPVQDLIGLDNAYRINLPGTVGNNWEPRFTAAELESIDEKWLLGINKVTQRI